MCIDEYIYTHLTTNYKGGVILAFYFDSFGFYKIGNSGLPADPSKNIYVARWDILFSYDVDMIVAYEGGFYKSLVDPNLGNNPSTSPTEWEVITGVDAIPYKDTFVIADWISDGLGGFYIDYLAATHLQGTSKFVYAFISSDTLDPNEGEPFGYGDFTQYSNGDIKILSDMTFNGYLLITSFANGGGSTTSGDYNTLTSKPVLNTSNTITQSPNIAEIIQGTIDLHKVSKTGDYNDLLNLPESTIPEISLIPNPGYLFPLSTTRAYYEKILYSPTAIFRDGTNLRKYVAYYGNGTYNFVSYSDNGTSWNNETQVTGVLAGYHCEAILIGTTIHLFYWYTGITIYSPAAIRHCTINITTNCSIAISDAPLSGNYISGVSGGGNLRAGTYGCDKAFYNASPTNNPLNPYSYQWCIIHNGTDGSQEGELFATSSDGYNFSAWNGNTEVIARGTQSPLQWDAWIGNCYVWTENSKWYMYYAGGIGTSNGADSNFANGIGYATSDDGITWTKYENNPIFFRTFSYKSALRLYCPCVVKQDDGWVLYYTSKSSDGKYRVCTAIIDRLI